MVRPSSTVLNRRVLLLLLSSLSLLPSASLTLRRDFLSSSIFTANSVAASASASVAAQKYDQYAPSYDNLDSPDSPLPRLLSLTGGRRRLLSSASGDVFEIGAGTGANLAFYNFSSIDRLTLSDVSKNMLDVAKRKLEDYPKEIRDKVKFVINDGILPPNPNPSSSISMVGRFDSVVCTFTLCVIGGDESPQVLSNMSSLLKPGSGTAFVFENTLPVDPFLSKYFSLAGPIIARADSTKLCKNDIDVTQLIERTDMRIVKKEVFASGLFTSYICKKN